MKTFLVMVGRTDVPWLHSGIDEYVKRIGRYIPFQTVVIQDVKRSKTTPEAVLKKEEGIQILKKIAPGDVMVLLDENGTNYSSRDFAGFLQKQMNSGIRNLFFIIGGAYGFSDEVYQRCDFKLSLSKMTFSHQMVRLIFTEQLYRAMTIINNEPYHHD